MTSPYFFVTIGSQLPKPPSIHCHCRRPGAETSSAKCDLDMWCWKNSRPVLRGFGPWILGFRLTQWHKAGHDPVQGFRFRVWDHRLPFILCVVRSLSEETAQQQQCCQGVLKPSSISDFQLPRSQRQPRAPKAEVLNPTTAVQPRTQRTESHDSKPQKPWNLIDNP